MEITKTNHHQQCNANYMKEQEKSNIFSICIHPLKKFLAPTPTPKNGLIETKKLKASENKKKLQI